MVRKWKILPKAAGIELGIVNDTIILGNIEQSFIKAIAHGEESNAFLIGWLEGEHVLSIPRLVGCGWDGSRNHNEIELHPLDGCYESRKFHLVWMVRVVLHVFPHWADC